MYKIPPGGGGGGGGSIASSRPTRGSLFNFVVTSIKGCDSHTFYYNAILNSNRLPDDIKSITNKSSYKK